MGEVPTNPKEMGASKKDFNLTHPELLEDEVFLTNSSSEDLGAIGYKTKRCGEQAYDINGKPFSGLIPVFVQKEEFDKVREKRIKEINSQK